MVAVAAIALGMAIGFASGGSARALTRFDSAGLWPLLLLYGVQGVARGRIAGTVSTQLGILVWASVSVALCVYVFMVAPRLLPEGRLVEGFSLVAVGTAGNVIAVLLNQAMPVAHLPEASKAIAESAGFYAQLNAGTVVPWLGDVLVVRAAEQVILLSIGDVLLAVGVAVTLIELMLRLQGTGSSSGLSADPLLPR